MNLFIAAISVLLLAFILFLAVLSVYSRLVMLKNSVYRSFSHLERLLQQRVDECSALSSHLKISQDIEQEDKSKLLNLRVAFLNSHKLEEKVSLSNQQSQLLKNMFNQSEQCEMLQGNVDFQQIKQRIATIESEIAERREYFNTQVEQYNSSIKSFPNLLLTKILGYQQQPILDNCKTVFN